MKIVAGLGNPGAEYAATRHNVGYRVLDIVAARTGAAPWRTRFKGLAAKAALGGAEVWLLKPTTFMNASGESVAEAVRFYKVAPEDLLVVADDMGLEPGALRVRRGGSSGGHKGLQSVEEMLGTSEYPRLRVGIGPSPETDATGYVLGRFRPSELAAAAEAELRAADAVETWVLNGVERCMNDFN